MRVKDRNDRYRWALWATCAVCKRQLPYWDHFPLVNGKCQECRDAEKRKTETPKKE
jgi:exosome complex RNA-binding protein Csl4